MLQKLDLEDAKAEEERKEAQIKIRAAAGAAPVKGRKQAPKKAAAPKKKTTKKGSEPETREDSAMDTG